MPAVLNSGTGGDLNPGLDGTGGPVATATAIVRHSFLSTSLGDAISAQVSYGFDQVSGEARIVLPAPSGSVGDGVSVTLGAGNNLQRFAGTLVSFDTTLWPHSVMAICKGPLYVLEEFENGTATIATADGSNRPGLDFVDLVGGRTATLRTVIAAVLDRVGVSYSLSNFADPAHLYGVDALNRDGATDALLWGSHETAAAYIHRFLEASAGYRLFDSTDGNIYLQQISAIPSGSDMAFQLGVDIFGDSQSSSTRIGQRSGVLVQGYDDGSGPATSGLIGSSPIFPVNSSLIETDAFAVEIANFWLTQVNRLQEIVRMSTPRDDLIGPAQTHTISGLGADSMWVKSFTAEVAANGEFTQRMVYVAGA